jgi:hypothetical protein
MGLGPDILIIYSSPNPARVRVSFPTSIKGLFGYSQNTWIG